MDDAGEPVTPQRRPAGKPTEDRKLLRRAPYADTSFQDSDAWRALRNEDWRRVGELCVLSSALRTSREARAALENIGRQRAELAATLRESPLAREYLRQASKSAWPGSTAVAAALEGRILGAPIDAVLAGVFYSSVMSLLSAAMKILRLGQIGRAHV